MAALVLILAVSLTLAEDVRQLFDAYQQGRRMAASDAEKLETKLSSKPGDIPDRICLIAFYTLASEVPATEESRERPPRTLAMDGRVLAGVLAVE